MLPAGSIATGAVPRLKNTLGILIVGGYGTFGRRIVELLEHEPRLTLIVAARSRKRAQTLVDARGAARATLIATAFDRDGDIDDILAAARPDILVDASGPFQAYGERPYRLIEACIAHGINYLDLADSSDFVAGVAGYDAMARAAGVFVLSGVSSFPVLTAAVVRHLASGLARVDSIRAGIAPSPFAGVGRNVIRAIAGYAGKPIRLRRDGAIATGHPFTEQMRFTIGPPGHSPIRCRLFSLVDVPDLDALAQLWPEVRTIWMGAAPVPAILHWMLIALAWLTRLRVVPSLSSLAPPMLFASNHLRWGAHRGGMFVEIDGTNVSGEHRGRSWHMVAEGDDGPFVPSMAVAGIVRRILDRRVPPAGARAATRELELDDYHVLFAHRKIVSGVRNECNRSGCPLYTRVLTTALERLPGEIRAMHAVTGTMRAEGRASIERGRGLLARIAAAIIGFPAAAADCPLRVCFAAAHGIETWTRTFGDRSFVSRQFAGRGRWEHLLCERFGWLTFAMAPVVNERRLSLVSRGWSLFGVPLPMALCPRADAFETVDDGRFRFHVEIGHGFTGLIVRYRGWLVPADEAMPAKQIEFDETKVVRRNA
jgi:Domain of unknown function (DUF4166)/Saccharopine dehydrogenase NADP binding domain